MAENRKNGTDAENGADNNSERFADATPELRAVHRAETCADAGADICAVICAESPEADYFSSIPIAF